MERVVGIQFDSEVDSESEILILSGVDKILILISIPMIWIRFCGFVSGQFFFAYSDSVWFKIW